jgi:glycosyltransferase involved in cell wall biosynthesis
VERSSAPIVSVVIPVLDMATTIKAQVEAVLEQYHEQDFEVVIADNGSVDGTVRIIRELSSLDDRLKFVDAAWCRPGGAAAKNQGVKQARGRWILFCDADDLVQPMWMYHLVSRLETGSQVVVATREYWLLNPFLRNSGYPRQKDQGSLPGGAFGISRDLYMEMGGFSEDFAGAVDSEFGRRLELIGVSLDYVSQAVVSVRTPLEYRACFRRSRALGRSRCLLPPTSKSRSVTIGFNTLALLRKVVWLIYRSPKIVLGQGHMWVEVAGATLGEIEGLITLIATRVKRGPNPGVRDD